MFSTSIPVSQLICIHLVKFDRPHVQEFADKALMKDTDSISAFLELHIEQGPHLEAEKKDIGIVEAIMAPALLRVEFTGRGGHGGDLQPLQQRSLQHDRPMICQWTSSQPQACSEQVHCLWKLVRMNCCDGALCCTPGKA